MKKILLLASSALLISACSTTTEKQPESMVYINTGAIQCELEGQTGVQTARLLTDNNIDVSKTQCGQLTDVGVASVCGGATVDINVHAIPTNKIAYAQALGFEDVATLKTETGSGYSVSDCKK